MADLATGLKAWVAAQLPDTDTGAGPITPTIHRGALTPIIEAVQGVEDRVDVLYGRPVFTESQRAGLQYIIDQTGGAEGLVLAVAANSDKISFDPESRATLTRLAGETQRSEEDVLALIHSAPIPTAVAAEFLSVHGDIDTINGRIDNLPVSEGVPQSVLDDIQALKDRLEFTPAEQVKIMANAGGIADNAQAILDLIQSVADANARIDGNRDARRITPQEILDIADLKDNLVLTQSEKDKINASDAVHSELSGRIKALEDAPAAEGGIGEWNATTTYNTGELVITDTGIYRAIADNISSAATEPAVGAAWEAGWELVADAKDASGLALTDFQGDGDGVGAVDARIDIKQDPSLFQSLAGPIPAQRPHTSFVVNAGNSPLTTDPLTIPTDHLTGFKDGEVVRIDGALYFDGEYTGFAPTISAVVEQDGNTIKNLYNLPAQGAGSFFFYARLGGGTITITPTASLNTELEATLYPYTGGLRASLLGKYHNIAVELINTQIAIALAETKLQVAQNTTGIANNLADIAVLQQTLTALNNAFQALTIRLDNAPLKFLMAGSVVAAENTITQARTPLGDTWNARMEEAGAPYTPQVVVDLTQGSIQYGTTAGSADEKSVLAYESNGWVYGRAFTPAIDHPQQTNQHETTYVGTTQVDSQNRFRIDLGVNNQFVASTTSFRPSEDIPAGTIVHVDFHAYVNETARQIAEIDYVWGSGTAAVHEIDHEGQTSIIGTVREFNGDLEVAITESTDENNLPVDGGYVLAYAHWETTTEAYTSPERVDDVQLMRHTGHAALVLANVNNNIVIYYGAGQSFETNHFSAAQVDFYIINGSTDALGAVYGIDAQETYDLTAIQANALAGVDYLGFFVDVPHATNQVRLPGGMVLTDPEEKERDILAELDALKAGGGASANGIVLATRTLRGSEIKIGSISFPEIAIGQRLFGMGVKVINPCANTDSISFQLVGQKGLEAVALDVAIESEVEENNNIARVAASAVSVFITGVDTSISADCEIKIAVAYMPIEYFPK